MGANWTTQQKDAIDARNSDILVSAAAGSGKTAVLVERIIQRITAAEHPINIDQLLVVTFTKAAASEMRERIGTAVAAKLEEQPQNVHLQNQLTYLSRADIMTIHAFCLQVIREFGYLLDIDPAAQTADPSEIQILQRDVLTELFEQLYEKEDANFLSLLETYGDATSDKRLKNLVLQVYEFAQGYPYPVSKLQEMAEHFALSTAQNIDDCSWMPLIQSVLSDQCTYAQSMLEKGLLRIAGDSDFTAYADQLTQDMEAIQSFQDSLHTINYAAWHTASLSLQFGRMPSYRGSNKDMAEYIKGIRNTIKAMLSQMRETYLGYGVEMQNHLIRQLYPIATALSDLTIQFMDAFATAKKEKLWLDFHDYEHFALQILTAPESTKEHIIPTNAAKDLQQKYEEVMIDEYQDSNLVQEMLLSAVSRESIGENNRFMVGDVKQSIYRFRLAMPELFNEKYHTYPSTIGGKTRKIVLSKNFRSRKNILDGINFIFYQLMCEQLGDVAYNDETALYYSGNFPECEGLHGGANEVILMDLKADDADLPEEIAELGKQELEATILVQKINDLISSGYQVFDRKSNSYRPIVYRDIAILLRSVQRWGNTFDDVFGKAGIPFYAETAQGYYDVTEVDTVLNLLRLIDNPYQDIPLISLLHSPLYALSVDALAEVRLFGGDGLYYECVLRYIAEGSDPHIVETLKRFYDHLQDWRMQASQVSLQELLRYLYTDTGYYDYIGITEGGTLRQANLRLLIEKAENYEQSSGNGLFHFIRFVEDMKQSGLETSEAKVQSEAENLVQIMTIHKSKGLEFPVVFLPDLGKQFNQADIRASVLMHPTLGYGMNYTDIEKHVTYQTLSTAAISSVIRLENLSEEMRVLYVAMTRAKEKLILTGVVNDLAKSIEKWADTADTQAIQLPLFRLRHAHSYLDWVMPALLRHPAGRVLPEWLEPFDRGQPHLFLDEPSVWQMAFLEKQDLLSEITEQKEEIQTQKLFFDTFDATQDHSGHKSEIFRVLAWQYDHKKATTLPAKISISEIKRKHQEEMTGESSLPPTELTLPDLSATQQDEKVSRTQLGTAMHMVLEAADLRQNYDAKQLDALIAALVTQERMTPAEAAALQRKELLAFFTSDLAKRIQKAKDIHQEQPFSILMQPKDIYPTSEFSDCDEWIQVNGMIDCYFAEQDGLILIDYKNDRIYQEETFLEKYAIQLRLYREALQRATGAVVKETYLYSFAMQKAIPIE